MIYVPEEYQTGKVVVPKKNILAAAVRLAERIARDFRGTGIRPILLCVDEGAQYFFNILTVQLYERKCEYDVAHIRVKSYRKDESSGNVEISNYHGPELAGRWVIIVEDIIDTSLSMRELALYLTGHGVLGYDICTMLFKKRPDNLVWRLLGLRGIFGFLNIKYVGVFIENLFVVGCGLDYCECLRNLADVVVISPEAKRYIDKVQLHLL